MSVSEALALGRPVVALESTVITHGLPWPDNLRTARLAESAVHSAGAVPATIAIKGGVVHIGLTDHEMADVAAGGASGPDHAPAQRPGSGEAATRSHEGVQPGSGSFVKASRRDLSAVVAGRRNAGTTVSATLQLARRFLPEPVVMATGGVGGVHRQAAATFDVSTDLDELARADGAMVVCSGFKSILDLPATLEALETRGVLVVGYRTNELPGFLTRSSGLALEHRVDSPTEAAELARAHRTLALPGAIVLVQAVPEESAMDGGLLQEALERALRQAALASITGKALTPYLLESIRRATSGSSQSANCALLVSNARLAGEVAVALGARAPLVVG